MKDVKKIRDWNAWIRRGVLLAMVGAAVMLACGKTQPVASDPPEVTPEPVYADERTARERAFEADSQALERLTQSEDETVRQQAARQLEILMKEHRAELAIEEALQQSGMETAFVIASNGSVTVALSSEQEAQKNSAMILALCMAHADVVAENVRIMSASP
ncbi:MAG: SpoIIIAH-like family protein [Clostridia bacterium]|nr:SpoIIIAH-like family protein [Clostridia bacterium]